MSQATVSPRDLAAPRNTAQRRRMRSVVLRPLLMVGGVLLVLLAGGHWWLGGGRYVSIDNAYVRAGKLAVATDVSGIVAEVAVKEGQQVRQGDVLLRLDPRQFQIALDGARANLNQVALSMEAMKRDYQRMLRDIEAKRAQTQADQATFDRLSQLVRTGNTPRSDYDDARFKLAANQAAMESLGVQAQVQLARLGGRADIDVKLTPEYLRAQAQVEEAQRQLDHATIRAPFAGVVTQVDQTQPGMYLAAATAAFGLVSADHVWIEANPKETDLTHVKPGDAVTVTIDTYPGRTWHGTVASIAPNSGAEFSLLPAQNASGNWVKVVQRIPLRVRVDRAPDDPPLRTGMSAVVSIDTGHQRHLSDLIP